MEFIDFEASVVEDTDRLEVDHEERDPDKNFWDESQQEQSTSFKFLQKNSFSSSVKFLIHYRSDDNCKLDNCDVQPEMY